VVGSLPITGFPPKRNPKPRCTPRRRGFSYDRIAHWFLCRRVAANNVISFGSKSPITASASLAASK